MARGMTVLMTVLLILAATLTPAPGAAEAVEAPADYRTHTYRAPVPAEAPGATTLDTAAVRRLWQDKEAAFIDVFGAAVAFSSEGGYWITPRHDTIPGAIWLPNVGTGALSPAIQSYFEDNLARHTGGDKDRAILFYCRSDCWLSWNASKRARALGYTRIYWYPGGTDAWAAAGLPLVEAVPLLPEVDPNTGSPR